ncbi:helix-turn-helix domain-containing protein [Nocardia beijingensis]|uniref:helix-turn-helix domain-containing protein n=1 Tax=Nocardia beijingensis TaxID=95162 RepID=UPI001894D434|nr:helix-turn-helix domain-containing protein [Nocardia beijingensis]MBF6468637.1 helix-turn-helix domain-containing protein [Nocardia beijingensis]
MPVNEHPTERTGFAERLRVLLDQSATDPEARITVKELSRRTRAAGAPVSEPYLYQLLDGRRKNPSLAAVRAIAAALEVPAAYFVDTADPESSLERPAGNDLSDLQDELRQLDPENLRHAREFVAFLLARQRLRD